VAGLSASFGNARYQGVWNEEFAMKYLLLGLQLFPAILAAIRAAEEHVALPAAGSEKLAMVTGVVDEVYASVEDEIGKDYEKQSVVRLITGLVGRVVAVFNKLGIFKKN
jgi:hypothetical protein